MRRFKIGYSITKERYTEIKIQKVKSTCLIIKVQNMLCMHLIVKELKKVGV